MVVQFLVHSLRLMVGVLFLLVILMRCGSCFVQMRAMKSFVLV